MPARQLPSGQIAPLPDITGQRFGRLVVVGKDHKTARHGWMYKCACDCGGIKVALHSNILKGDTTSCGCFHSEQSSRAASTIPDITGRKVGRLLVLGKHHKPPQMGWKYECVCECGRHVIIGQWKLFHEEVHSCGCWAVEKNKIRSTTHGCSNSVLYRIWAGIIKRCTNPNGQGAHRYIGRGISVCDRWTGDNGFENFMADMGPRPSPIHSVDRIDNDGNYEPDNCKWSTPKEQARNRQRRVLWKGRIPVEKAEEYALSRYHGAMSEDLAKEVGMSVTNFNSMLRRLYQFRWEQQQFPKGLIKPLPQWVRP